MEKINQIPNFNELLNQYLSKYKNNNNHILDINDYYNHFKKFINNKSIKYINYESIKYNYDTLDKFNNEIIIKLFEYKTDKKEFDIIYLDTNYKISNIILICEELFKLLKSNGIFIYNNYGIDNHEIKINLDTFIELKKNEIDILCIDSLIIFKKSKNKIKLNKTDQKIDKYIKNVSQFFPKLILHSDHKIKLIFDLKFDQIKNKILYDKSLISKLNTLKKKYINFTSQNELFSIRMKAIDNFVFTRHRPYLNKKFSKFFTDFLKDSFDPIRYNNFYNFLNLATEYSDKKKDFEKYGILKYIQFPNKKNIIYLHTVHNHTYKYKKMIHPYILFGVFKKYINNNKIDEFTKLIKKKPNSILKETNLPYFEKFIKNGKELNSFEQISHMLPYEYENKNNDVNLSKPSRRISFEIKNNDDIKNIKLKLNKYNIKSIDIIKIDSFYQKSYQIQKFPRSKYYIHLLLNNIVFLLNFQSKNGSSYLATFGLYEDLYIDLIQILKKYYKTVSLKFMNWSWSEQPSTPNYFIICEGFLGINKIELTKFNELVDTLYENDSDLGRYKQKISNILDKKSYKNNEKQMIKKTITKFNNSILNYIVFKYKYYFELYDYFFNKESKNKILMKKKLLSRQIDDTIIFLNHMNLHEYRLFF